MPLSLILPSGLLYFNQKCMHDHQERVQVQQFALGPQSPIISYLHLCDCPQYLVTYLASHINKMSKPRLLSLFMVHGNSFPCQQMCTFLPKGIYVWGKMTMALGQPDAYLVTLQSFMCVFVTNIISKNLIWRQFLVMNLDKLYMHISYFQFMVHIVHIFKININFLKLTSKPETVKEYLDVKAGLLLKS